MGVYGKKNDVSTKKEQHMIIDEVHRTHYLQSTVVIDETAVAQIAFNYGINTLEEVDEGGTYGISNNNVVYISSINGTLSFLASRTYTHGKSGQGGVFRINARFEAPNAAGISLVGAFNLQEYTGFMYSGTTFGIVHNARGKVQKYRLEITAPATGAETATVTVDGNATNIALTAGTVAHNAFELAKPVGTYTNAISQQVNGGFLEFSTLSVGASTGTWTFSSTGTAAGTFTQLQDGQDGVNMFIEQSEWNRNTLLDTENNPFVLNTTKFNVYEIKLSCLGSAGINYYLHNPENNEDVLVHVIEYGNFNETIEFLNMSFQVGAFVINYDTTPQLTYLTHLYSAELQKEIVTPFKSFIASKTVSTTETVIVSGRNSNIFNDIYIVEGVIVPKRISFSNESTGKAMTVRVIANAVLTEPNWQYVNKQNSLSHTDIASTSYTGGEIITIFVVSPISSASFVIESARSLRPFDSVTITAQLSGGTASAGIASIEWEEIK